MYTTLKGSLHTIDSNFLFNTSILSDAVCGVSECVGELSYLRTVSTGRRNLAWKGRKIREQDKH